MTEKEWLLWGTKIVRDDQLLVEHFWTILPRQRQQQGVFNLLLKSTLVGGMDPTNNDDNSAKPKDQRMTMDTLHREMDLAEYSKGSNGQYRRVTPKNLTKDKTRKRRLLEREDYENAEPEPPEATQANVRRLRGSRLALEDTIMEGSMPLLTGILLEQQQQEEQQEQVELAENHDHDEADDQDDNSEEQDDDDNNDNDNNNDEDENDEYVPAAEQKTNTNSSQTETTQKKRGPYKKKKKTYSNSSSRNKKTQPPANSQKARRRLFRLKNFKSFKMAQRHGEALGAHARGNHVLAIAKLKQIAKDAPSAPQVYSSLGMVYTDMYQTCWKNIRKQHHDHYDNDNDNDNDNDDTTTTIATTNKNSREPFCTAEVAEAIDFAQKAYGSYHIAAVLCKKDYLLWVRAADTAIDIASLLAMTTGDHHDAVVADIDDDAATRKEQQRWLAEAKSDLQTADNLKTPNLDVPIKLAGLYVELGCLSEALTLWMDLLQRQNRSHEFRHNAWTLYSESMLRIGWECQEWNAGRQDNPNYMFRRWLRKFSQIFDWRERRLQGLVRALEAAAGSTATRRVVEWMRHRAMERHEEVMKAKAKQKAAEVFADSLIGDDHDNKGNELELASESRDFEEARKGSRTTLDALRTDEDKNGSETDLTFGHAHMENETDPTMEVHGAEMQPAAGLDANNEYDTERRLLLENNIAELAAFDQTTASMIEVLGKDDGDNEGSGNNQQEAIKQRQVARGKMKRYHKAQVDKLAAEYQREAISVNRSSKPADSHVNKGPNNSGQEADEDQDLPLTSSGDQEHPLTASCHVVCRIAAELMRAMLEMKLHHGGRLVGEAVSLYMKERARVHDKKMARQRRMLQREDPLARLFSTQAPTCDGVSYCHV
jgi:hypothetical protein